MRPPAQGNLLGQNGYKLDDQQKNCLVHGATVHIRCVKVGRSKLRVGGVGRGRAGKGWWHICGNNVSFTLACKICSLWGKQGGDGFCTRQLFYGSQRRLVVTLSCLVIMLPSVDRPNCDRDAATAGVGRGWGACHCRQEPDNCNQARQQELSKKRNCGQGCYYRPRWKAIAAKGECHCN